MRSLIITVAGTATRFNRDTASPTLKCLYTEGGYEDTLLYRILQRAHDYDEYIIVGGYLFDKLTDYVNRLPIHYRAKTKLVYNEHYADYGSCYSLLLGINNVSDGFGEVTFVEGDLYFDRVSFRIVTDSLKSIFTVNHELITARKAVAAYSGIDNRIHYLYDTSHRYLEIKEPFSAVYNSGQIWKFADTALLRKVAGNLTEEQRRGTNLEIVQQYFDALKPEEYAMVECPVWFNCNTVNDYRQVFKIMKSNEDIG